MHRYQEQDGDKRIPGQGKNSMCWRCQAGKSQIAIGAEGEQELEKRRPKQARLHGHVQGAPPKDLGRESLHRTASQQENWVPTGAWI